MERKFTLSRFLEMLNEWKHTATLFPVICVKWLPALASHSLRRHVSYCRLLIKLSTSRQISIFPKTLNCFFKGKSPTERAGKQSKCTIIPISTWGCWIVWLSENDLNHHMGDFGTGGRSLPSSSRRLIREYFWMNGVDAFGPFPRTRAVLTACGDHTPY